MLYSLTLIKVHAQANAAKPLSYLLGKFYFPSKQERINARALVLTFVRTAHVQTRAEGALFVLRK